MDGAVEGSESAGPHGTVPRMLRRTVRTTSSRYPWLRFLADDRSVLHRFDSPLTRFAGFSLYRFYRLVRFVARFC